MSSEERTAWYKAALMTIGDMPEDILRMACEAARKACDHPAKIVPFICDMDGKREKPWLSMLAWRRRRLSEDRKRFENVSAPRLTDNPDYMTAQDLAELKAELTNALRT